MSQELETRSRFGELFEARAQSAIEGYAAVFYEEDNAETEFRLPGFDSVEVYERVMPGAFDRTIREDDILGLYNHDPNYVLGRRTAGTLRLGVDKRGLSYFIPPGSPHFESVRTSIRRGDVTGSSFSFKVPPGGDRLFRDGDRVVRELRELTVGDVGPVIGEAYPGTTATARSVHDYIAGARGGRLREIRALEFRLRDELGL